ncbi:unnamed protein product [Prunus armeniaca]
MSWCSKVVRRPTLQDTTTYDPHKCTLAILGSDEQLESFLDKRKQIETQKLKNVEEKIMKKGANLISLFSNV